MIARPKMSQNEWKTTEIQASKVGNFSPFSCPGEEKEASGVVWSASTKSPSLEAVLFGIKDKIRKRRVLLKPTFQDFDPRRNEHVTRDQFERVLAQWRPGAGRGRFTFTSTWVASKKAIPERKAWHASRSPRSLDQG